MVWCFTDNKLSSLWLKFAHTCMYVYIHIFFAIWRWWLGKRLTRGGNKSECRMPRNLSLFHRCSSPVLLPGCPAHSLITTCAVLLYTIPVMFTIHINCIILTADSFDNCVTNLTQNKTATGQFSLYHAGRKKCSWRRIRWNKISS